MEEMVVRGEMRGVVVGRSPGQSPGSHTRDSSQRDTARCTCFAVTCALTSFRNAAFSASARSPSGTAGELSGEVRHGAKLIVLRKCARATDCSIIIWTFLGTPDRLVMVSQAGSQRKTVHHLVIAVFPPEPACDTITKRFVLTSRA